MKTNTLLMIVFCLVSWTLCSFTHSDKQQPLSPDYVASIQNLMASIEDASNIEELQNAAQEFAQLTTTHKSNWEAMYYTAYCYISMCAQERVPAQKAIYLDQAQSYIEAAKQLTNNAELHILQAYLYQCRANANINMSAANAASLVKASLAEAQKMDANNPRIYFLKAQNLYFSSSALGGLNTACPVIQEAIQKYETYQPATPISPNWGKNMTQEMYAVCQSAAGQ
ncbi:MAG: hypothetical protein R3E32_20545 [Chitinophagales bacterium]